MPSGVTEDIVGEDRIVDSPDHDDTGIPDAFGETVDLGPYEFPIEACPGDVDGSGTVDFGDLLIVLGS